MTSVADDPITGFDPDAIVRSETVEIAAPASVVWQVLIDLPRYNEWNPSCIRADSTLEMGAPVNMVLQSYAEPGKLFHVVEYICAFEPERLLSWAAPYDESWPYPARRDQVIEQTGATSCRYHSTDAFYGEHGIHVFRFAGPWVKRSFDDSAYALKARAEAIHSGQVSF